MLPGQLALQMEQLKFDSYLNHTKIVIYVALKLNVKSKVIQLLSANRKNIVYMWPGNDFLLKKDIKIKTIKKYI